MKKRIIAIFLVILMLACSIISINASSTDPELAEFYYGTPVIDGEIEDLWDSVPAYYVQYNTGTSNKPLDTASAYFKGMWDEQYVYLLGYVSDKTLNTAAHETESWGKSEFWQVDSHHFFMDFANSGTLDFKLEIMAYGQDRGRYPDQANYYSYSHKTGSDYYYFEAKIEVSKFVTTFKNDEGTTFRLDYQVNDNTNANTGSREECYLWNDETGGSNGNAALCGIVNLVGTKATSASAEAIVEIIEAPAVIEAAATAETTPAPVIAPKAPQTNDSSMIFVIIGLLAVTLLFKFTYRVKKSV